MAGETDAKPAERRATGTRWRWAFVAAAALVVVLLVSAFRLLPFGSEIMADVHRRNAQDLEIAAQRLESWSDAIGGVARGNYIRGRVGAIESGDRDFRDGWQVRARLRHPELGPFRVVYKAVRGDGEGPPCRTLAGTVAGREGRLPFVRSYTGGGATMLKVLGQFEVAEIWALDMRSDIGSAGREGGPGGRPWPTVKAYLDDIQTGASAEAGATVVCYGAVIELDRLLAPPEGGRAFSSLLVAGPRGEILAQLGPEILPLASIEALKPAADEDMPQLVKAGLSSAGVALTDEQAAKLVNARKPEAALVDNLAPVEVPVGDRTFIAYVRPFHPPGDGFPSCLPETGRPAGEPAARASGGVTVTASLEGGKAAVTSSVGASASRAAAVVQEPPSRGRCHVVALVPKPGLWRQVVNPPPGPLFALALALGGILVLLPALRLMLLGPGDALGRAEAAAVALGLPAAASLATLALLVSADVGAHRASAARTSEAIALKAAGAIAAELAPRLQASQQRASALSVLDRDDLGSTLVAAEQAMRAPRDGRAFDVRSLPWHQACLAASLAVEGEALPSIGLVKPADPRPLRCVDSDACVAMTDTSTGLPLLELGGLIADSGRQVAGLRSISCRNAPGGRTELAGRDYFRRLASGRAAEADLLQDQSRHVVEQVLALQDGLPQTVIARAVPSIAAASGEAYLVATTTLPTLVRPVVAAPFQLIVVDARDPRMRVVAHSVPGRAGAERFAAMVEDGAHVRARLWAESRRYRAAVEQAGNQPVGAPRPFVFHGFYDGDERHFAAVPVPGTSWIAIGSFPEGAIDRLPIDTGWRALLSWAAVGMMSGAVWLGWLALSGRDGRSAPPAIRGLTGWSRLWPQELHRDRYEELCRDMLLLAQAGLLLLLLAIALQWHPLLLVVFALAVRGAAALWLHRRLGDPPTDAERAIGTTLTPGTERRYRRLSAALMLCLSLVPMLGLWLDSRAHTVAKMEAGLVQQLAAPGGTLERRQDAFRDLGEVLGLKRVRVPEKDSASHFGFGWDRQAVAGAAHGRLTFAGEISRVQGAGATPAVAGCGTLAAGREPRLCGDPARGIAWAPPGVHRVALEPHGYGLLLLLAAGLAALLAFFIRHSLRALAGFGIALEAVRYPRLFLGSLWGLAPDALPGGAPELQTLNRKSLLVNAPYSILPMLSHFAGTQEVIRRIRTLDIAEIAAAADTGAAPARAANLEVRAGDILLLVGLELVLADAKRRLAALARLEQLVAAVDAAASLSPEPYLLFLSPSAPMDRILDAYERESSASGTAIDANRENLRWARLFEDFATFQFRPVELTAGVEPAAPPPGLDSVAEAGWARLMERFDQRGPDEQAAIATVFSELRWMSPRVVNGCINEERDVALPPELLERGIVPVARLGALDASPYPALYGQPVLEWALARHFAGPQAALAYLKGQFIEHYQRLWSASTRAERLVLHHLAHGRFVNIGASAAFGSLVRRGLVVLDPEPRIMNRSFAMFVAQVEKLDSIREWRGELPSAWLKARLPILGGIAAAVMLLAGLLAAGEQPLKLLIPVLAAGGPILAAGLWRTVRGS
jgi:hypothetical protein